MFYLTGVLQFIVDSLDDRPFPEEDLVIEIHQRVLQNLQSSWEWVFVRNCLIITHKVTKNIPFPQLF